MSHEQAKQLFAEHKLTGEPLAEDEVTSIVGAGLAGETDFEYTGGGLYRYHGPDMRPEETDDGFGDSIDAAESAHQQVADGCPCDEFGEHAPR